MTGQAPALAEPQQEQTHTRSSAEIFSTLRRRLLHPVPYVDRNPVPPEDRDVKSDHIRYAPDTGEYFGTFNAAEVIRAAKGGRHEG